MTKLNGLLDSVCLVLTLILDMVAKMFDQFYDVEILIKMLKLKYTT